MAEKKAPNADPDRSAIDLVRALADLLRETDLVEIDYAEGGRHVRLVRGRGGEPSPVAIPVAPAATGSPLPLAEPAGTVTAPMVGTIYLATQPEAPPFIRLGDTVEAGQTLLIIEAMKVMNQIAAPRAGRIAAIHVSDGMPVEYGQPLLVLA
ncbi:MAG: acetyl-CoA carboxylase biotin carboxyl carrier protein [Stellaceae bacterium]